MKNYVPVLGSICTGGMPMCAGGGEAKCSLLYIISDVNAPGCGGCNGCLLPYNEKERIITNYVIIMINLFR